MNLSRCGCVCVCVYPLLSSWWCQLNYAKAISKAKISWSILHIVHQVGKQTHAIPKAMHISGIAEGGGAWLFEIC